VTATPASGRISFAARHPWIAHPWGRPAMFAGIFLVGLLAQRLLADGAVYTTNYILLFLLAGWASIAFVPARVEVGADGVSIGWLGSIRFIPFRELDQVEFNGNKIVLVLGRRAIYLDPLKPRRRPGLHIDTGSLQAPGALLDRLAAVRQARFPYELEQALARGARAPAQWLSFLEQRAPRSTGYRDAAPDRPALLNLALSPAARPSARGASAWLLMRHGLLPEDRQQLLDAALSTADRELRSALARAAGSSRSSLAASALLSGLARRGG
jgi:hypothetical protein